MAVCDTCMLLLLLLLPPGIVAIATVSNLFKQVA